MRLTHTCIVSKSLEGLREFYKEILQVQPQVFSENYVEFITERGTLSLFSFAAHERLAPGSVEHASNRSIILEFEVEDVDREYERLRRLEVEWVKPPTTQPWGNRSFYLRDPDGNLVSFYTTVKSR